MVVVTGIGMVSPHGDDAHTAFGAVVRGESAVKEMAGNNAVAIAAAPFDATRWFTRLQLTGVDRVSQLAVAAAELAWADALLSERPDAGRLGIYAGCGMGGAASLETAYVAGARGGRTPPLTVPAFMPNAPAAHIAMRLGVKGPVLTYSIACAASAVAIAEATKAIAADEFDIAIAGGAEALLVPGVVQAWQAMHTLARFTPGNASSACRPFASDRSGFALGEGSAFVILESELSARARGARVYAEIAGSGVSCDATHLTKPDVDGQTRALRTALHKADLLPEQIGYCNAHGTATTIGDQVESDALRAIWGSKLERLKVSSTKALHGHLLGAAGALEAALTILALWHRQLPPNAHCETPDPACALNLVARGGAAAPDLKTAISSSFAFGGTNAVLVFKSPH